MPEVYLASSVLAHDPKVTQFEAKKTLKLATEHSFDGVQLFLDPRFEKPEYVHSVYEAIVATQLDYFLHLPNNPNSAILKALEILADLPTFRGAITHDLPAPQTTVIPMGMENSVNGLHDREHIDKVFRFSRQSNHFFVYDFGRSFWASSKKEQEFILADIAQRLLRLDPENDILHIAGKSSWVDTMRNKPCTFVDGVGAVLLPLLQNFSGIIVCEYEDLDFALKDRAVLKFF